jgi:hypothetical protein
MGRVLRDYPLAGRVATPPRTFPPPVDTRATHA